MLGDISNYVFSDHDHHWSDFNVICHFSLFEIIYHCVIGTSYMKFVLILSLFHYWCHAVILIHVWLFVCHFRTENVLKKLHFCVGNIYFLPWWMWSWSESILAAKTFAVCVSLFDFLSPVRVLRHLYSSAQCFLFVFEQNYANEKREIENLLAFVILWKNKV